MTDTKGPSLIQRWLYHPQRQALRKALFQIHLWCGICLGLYIFFISITGSVLVYRNELYVAATPNPLIAETPAAVLDDAVLQARASQNNPGYELGRFVRASNDEGATEIWLIRGENTIKRFYDPRTGEDVGSAERLGQNAVITLISLHESFMAGETGRKLNGIAALFVVLLVLTGLVIWWPGMKRWRRSLYMHRAPGIKWKRSIWDLHSMIGIWTALFILIFAVSGVYLCFPDIFHELGDRLQPITDDNAGQRFVDRALYWLAFLHFGRINGIGLICDGPGLCDQSVKALWAVVGLAPAMMFVTGSTMWWNRVLSRWLHRH